MKRYDSYSRLSWVEERKLRRKSYVFGILAIFLFFGFVFWGIPGIPKIFTLIRDISSSGNLPSSYSGFSPPPPKISPLPAATNSAELYVSGSAEPHSSVEISLNKQSQSMVIADESGVFRSYKLILSEGTNLITVTAISKAGGRSLPSGETKIIFDKNPPEIEIFEPQDGQRVVGIKKNLINISGKVNKQVNLTLNERFVLTSATGEFSVNYTLSPGDNVLNFIATDTAGNTTTKSLRVSYEP
jgi:hypothetical protein